MLGNVESQGIIVLNWWVDYTHCFAHHVCVNVVVAHPHLLDKVKHSPWWQHMTAVQRHHEASPGG